MKTGYKAHTKPIRNHSEATQYTLGIVDTHEKPTRPRFDINIVNQ